MEYEIKRGIDRLGEYWSVFYAWWYDGEMFSFGSCRAYEDLIPEVENIGWVSEDTLETIKYIMLEQEIR